MYDKEQETENDRAIRSALHRCISIAVRTFFCDVQDKEIEIFDWLGTTTDKTFENTTFVLWSEVEHLSPASIFCLVDNLATEILDGIIWFDTRGYDK